MRCTTSSDALAFISEEGNNGPGRLSGCLLLLGLRRFGVGDDELAVDANASGDTP